MRKLLCHIVFFVLVTATVVAPAQSRPAPDSFAPLIEKLSPAVVNISTTQKIKSRVGGGMGMPFMFQFPDEPQFDPFRDFFERFGQQQGPGGAGKPMEREVYSLGSGFIIDADGYVVTNSHVIADAEEIQVILHDDTKLEATIVGRDSKTDLALLKVESKKPLPYVRLGNSDQVRVGDWVIAIGNPFGLGGTVTAGIISARSRSINAGPFDDFLQTDAAINRGNSGGPMFDLNGEVIGINTAIFSPSGGNIGIGFAVPASQAKPILEQLKEHGRTFRGWLGVKIQQVTEEVAESLGMPRAYGALVLEINENSPASDSDIQPGDIIIEFDGKEVEEMRKLPRLVAETKIGKDVEVVIWRNGEQHVTSVTLGELDETKQEVASLSESGNKAGNGDLKSKELLGMELVTVDADLRKRFEVSEEVAGILVLNVKPGSASAKQEILTGDIITRVNDRNIRQMDDFTNALRALKKSGRGFALVRVLRNGENLFVTLPTDVEE